MAPPANDVPSSVDAPTTDARPGVDGRLTDAPTTDADADLADDLGPNPDPSCGSGPACQDGLSCVDGQCRCVASGSCGGCCSADACVALPVFPVCGIGGASCNTCDPAVSDRCDASGDCACGTSAPCADGLDCVGGQCKCIQYGRCGGCCQDDQCLPIPSSWPLCGTWGSPCITCDPAAAKACGDDGQCRCNNIPLVLQCPEGLTCTPMAVCECVAGGRCSGCCADTTTCVTATTSSQCGSGGIACDACSPTVADNCDFGTCACGSGPACTTGTCQSGSCQ